MTESEKLTVATRLYVRLRHNVGRISDAVWMSTNAEYAREIIRLARSHPDAELNKLADRFEELMFGIVRRAASPVETDEDVDLGNVSLRYTGALR
jgi:hypothetical protein